MTLIGSNCPASRVGRCVDCECSRTAQVFSDCAITKYINITSLGSVQVVGFSDVAACLIARDGPIALLNNPGLQGTPAARPPKVAAPVAHDRRLAGQYPGTCSGDSVDRQNDGAPVLCAAACVLAVLTYGEALSDRIVSRYFV